MTDHSELEECIREAQKALDDAKAAAAHCEFPKHVEPHPSHIEVQHAEHDDTAPPHVSVPGFASHHVERSGRVTVLVHDAEEEAKALAERVRETV